MTAKLTRRAVLAGAPAVAAAGQADKADDAPEACVNRAREAIDAVLRNLPPLGDDETLIERIYRQRLAVSESRTRDLPDDEANEWLKKHDDLEEQIGRFQAETLRDVEIKLTVLCDRLRENLEPHYCAEIQDLLIAQCARDDLRRLAGEARS